MRERWVSRGKIGVLLGGVATVVIGIGGGAVGYWYGQRRAIDEMPSARTVAALENMVRQQRSAIEEAKEDSLTNLDALGGRLGEMQAELLRLNALGDRLVQMGGLNRKEFDFDDPPPVGGPAQPAATHTRVEELAEEMSRLFRELEDRESKLNLLEQMIMERRLEAQTMPAGTPVRSGYITSKFGYRPDPINGRREFHSGIDFAGARGSDVVAVADGLVIFSGTRSGYGRTLEIRHGNGLVTRYGHNQKLLVKDGDLVKNGQTIATLGSTGRTTGPHVHFEVLKNGKPVDPMKYVELNKRDAEG
jgi:murein DD-endopeptidase MepM/ murein hydrolase activator NlpD